MGDKEQQTLPDFYALLAKDANQAIDGLLAFLKKSNKEVCKYFVDCVENSTLNSFVVFISGCPCGVDGAKPKY